ncbi:MAG TPA: OmpH family outer membrane protein [Anaerohalosphaeraceae bacterium]|nr:OmpH family outer membrane protein [Anaerohalosphaeraceae bacterium]
MKLSKMLLAGAIVVVLCLSFGYRQGVAAGEKQIAPAKIAVVDVTKVLQNSKKHKTWQEKMTAEETVMKAEFQKDKKALEALQANMDLLKAGSKDYVDAMKDFLDKKGLLEAKDKFYQEKVNMEMQQWTESLYTQMLTIIKDIAQKKGVDIVLAQEQLDLPSPSLRDFMLSIRTKKVLYCGDQVDITDEVMSALDASK